MTRRRGGGGEKSWGEVDTKASQTKGKAKDAKGKGKGKAGKNENSWITTTTTTTTTNSWKTVQELEAEMLIQKLQRGGGAEDAGAPKREASKQPLEARGSHCEVKKHSGMGCAVVSMESKQAREAVMLLALQRSPPHETKEGEERRPVLHIDGVSVQMRNHHDKGSGSDIVTDIFLAWGRQAEKSSPLSVTSLAQAIDQLLIAAYQGCLPTLQQVPSFGTAASGQPTPSPMVASPPPPPAMPMSTPMYDYSGMGMGMQHAPEVMYNIPVHQAQSYPGYYTNDLHANHDYNSHGQAQPPATPERRVFRIVDPKTQQTIEAPQTPSRPRVPSDQNTPEKDKVRRPLRIIDPSSGDQIDVMNFTPAKATNKAFSIVDPYSGTAIKV